MPLESSPENPQPLRLVAHLVRGWIERLGPVWVEAQLIEVSRRSGRTIFLTLRDKLAEVSVSVTVSPTTFDAAGPLREGSTVVARLKPSYYEPSGRFSFYCDALTPVGEGRLLARLEQTKRLLQAEGLFDAARKRRLPFLPRAVGLITGAGSAAERDVVENATRRWPGVRILTRHTLVQGAQAAEQVMAALERLDALPEVEVIVIARGGGSLEDLLPFSDEGLVRAVFDARTPVVSAIGHETDNPILDLVADVRASTPTDAAKRVVPDAATEREHVRQTGARLDYLIDTVIARQRDAVRALTSRPVLVEPTAAFRVQSDQLATQRQRSRRAIVGMLEREGLAVGHHLARVRAMSPKATLDRGYAIVLDPDGHALASVSDVHVGDDLLAYLADGELDVQVRQIRPGTRGAA